MKQGLKKIQFKNLLLVGFLILALLFFRFAKLKTAPSTILVDEANHGYIAYSLLQTGRDEHGQAWPLIFKAFGDQKLPAYAYSLLPFLSILPLETWVLRLPSVLAGILFVLAIYFLLKELKFSQPISLLGASAAAFSSWAFILSRFAYESNLGLLFFTLALMFYVRAKNRRQLTNYLLWAIFASLSLYSYIAYRLVTPIFFVCLIAIDCFKKSLDRKKIFLAVLSFILLILPIFLFNHSISNLARFQQVGFLADQGTVLDIDEKRTLCAIDLPRPICDVLWNKGSSLLKKVFFAYLNLFSPNYLFFQGDGANSYLSVGTFGQFSFLLLPAYLLAFLAFFKVKKNKAENFLLIMLGLGFLIAPLPAILSEIQKVRLSPVLPFFIIFFALGFQEAVALLNKKNQRQCFYLFFLLALPIYFAVYFINFSSIHVRKNVFAYDAYVPKIFSLLEKYEADNYQIYLEGFFSDPIMYYAFYRQIDPQFYQDNVVLGPLEKSGFQHAAALGNYLVVHSLDEILEKRIDPTAKAVYVTNQQILPPQYLLENVWVDNPQMNYAFIYNLTNYVPETNNEKP